MNNISPIIRFEIEGMRQSIAAMLTEHALQIDADVNRAVDEYISSGNLERLITQQVDMTLNSVIKDEIESFFKYGEGRRTINQSVSSCLQNLTVSV